MTEDLTELGDLLGTGRVIEDPDLLVSYGTALRGPSGRAAFVAEPGDVSEVSAVAAWAYRHRRRLVVQGANTGLVGASTPDDSGDQGVLSLRRLDGIGDFDIVAKTIDVEAGVSLRALNDFLAPHQLFFPVEVGSNPTVGGMLATNAGGANTVRYGNAGDRVSGIEAVVADRDGSLIGTLDRPRKDNSRLDVTRMMVGSYGSLGVIVRARLSLADLPTTRATALLALETDEAVSECLRHLRPLLGESLLAFELISGEAMRMTLASSTGIPRPFGDREHGCYVLVEIGSGARSDLDATLADVLDHLVETNPGIMSDAVIAPPPDLWRLRHSLTEGTRGPGSTLRFDIGMSPAHLSELRRRLTEELAGPGAPTISEFGHWAEGGTHLQLIYQSILSPRQEETARQVVYDVVVGEFAGSFSAEHGLGPYNASFYERYIPPAERRLDRRLKSAFDPRGVWGREPLS